MDTAWRSARAASGLLRLFKNASMEPITSAPARSWPHDAKTVSKSRSGFRFRVLLICNLSAGTNPMLCFRS